MLQDFEAGNKIESPVSEVGGHTIINPILHVGPGIMALGVGDRLFADVQANRFPIGRFLGHHVRSISNPTSQIKDETVGRNKLHGGSIAIQVIVADHFDGRGDLTVAVFHAMMVVVEDVQLGLQTADGILQRLYLASQLASNVLAHFVPQLRFHGFELLLQERSEDDVGRFAREVGRLLHDSRATQQVLCPSTPCASADRPGERSAAGVSDRCGRLGGEELPDHPLVDAVERRGLSEVIMAVVADVDEKSVRGLAHRRREAAGQGLLERVVEVFRRGHVESEPFVRPDGLAQHDDRFVVAGRFQPDRRIANHDQVGRTDEGMNVVSPHGIPTAPQHANGVAGSGILGMGLEQDGIGIHRHATLEDGS